ncbi:hypothetical protein PAESOLCIP111_01315 [Paenibacillus solanacearum]|uniref:Uncharacterized protein n=1 Tax=Paenibacillus solanacearum TaxID=2048548 RepID=A0A916NGY1_9BACL|nr:hypothetical protein PAESOLCIP111_01315 [Paenibacillus solanacearum]
MRCKVINGYAEIGDVVTIISYGDEERYLYRVTGFQNYGGTPQINYRKVIPSSLEFFPEMVGSWMDFSEAQTELKIIQKQNNEMSSRLSAARLALFRWKRRLLYFLGV